MFRKKIRTLTTQPSVIGGFSSDITAYTTGMKLWAGGLKKLSLAFGIFVLA